jgi:hypothetical protein
MCEKCGGVNWVRTDMSCTCTPSASPAGYAVVEVPESVAVHVHRLEGEILRLRTALQMIAGQMQCADGLMCNVDIAKEALKYTA